MPIAEERRARREMGLRARPDVMEASRQDRTDRTGDPRAASPAPSKAPADELLAQPGRSPDDWLARLRATVAHERARTAGPSHASTPAPATPATPDASGPAARSRSSDERPQGQSGALPAPAAQPLAEATAKLVKPLAGTQASLARERREPNATPAAPPSLLPASTRRFVRPLVGIDPAQVRVHRGGDADRVTGAHRADAVTAGQEIWLGSGQADTPETLGLLAHELTHVARQVAPRFVPPIARAAGDAGTTTPASPEQHLADASEQSPATSGQETAREWVPRDPEEQLATVVEGAVRARAAAALSPSGTDGLETAAQIAQPPATSSSPIDGAVTHATPSPMRGAAVRDWGGLPAPWEPLPLPAATRGGETMPAPTTPGSTATLAAPSAVGSSAVQTAARGRTVPAANAETHDGGHSGGGEDSDVDALARKVYDALKRRLAVERRRGH
jgi:hypothetical protein